MGSLEVAWNCNGLAEHVSARDMGDVLQWDPLGQRERRRRLVISVSVAVVTATLLWHFFDSDAVHRWIWAHDGWRKLDGFINLTAVLIVPISYFAASALLTRHGRRRWLANRIPQGRQIRH